MCITVQKCCLCLHRRRKNVTSSVEIHVHFLAHVPFFFFVIASWSEDCLTCIRWFCPFTLYQNKSPGPSIHKCCCYGYNLDRSVCLTCYELQQFSDPVVPKKLAAQPAQVFFFLSGKKVYFNFSAESYKRHISWSVRHKDWSVCLFHAYRFVLNDIIYTISQPWTPT